MGTITVNSDYEALFGKLPEPEFLPSYKNYGAFWDDKKITSVYFSELPTVTDDDFADGADSLQIKFNTWDKVDFTYTIGSGWSYNNQPITTVEEFNQILANSDIVEYTKMNYFPTPYGSINARNSINAKLERLVCATFEDSYTLPEVNVTKLVDYDGNGTLGFIGFDELPQFEDSDFPTGKDELEFTIVVSGSGGAQLKYKKNVGWIQPPYNVNGSSSSVTETWTTVDGVNSYFSSISNGRTLSFSGYAVDTYTQSALDKIKDNIKVIWMENPTMVDAR